MMEVNLITKNEIPEESILSIRAGTVRRQATIASGRPFRFPKISMDENPLKIDILKQIGSAYLVMKPGEEQYKVTFQTSEGVPSMACEVEVKPVEILEGMDTGNGEVVDKKAEAASAKEAKDYLENHKVLQFVQAVLQTVIKERPSDPYAYIARHFMSGYEPADSKAPRPISAPPQPSDGTKALEDSPPAPVPQEEAKAAPPPEAPKEEAKAAPPADAPPVLQEAKAEAPAEAPKEEKTARAPEAPKEEAKAAPAPEPPKEEAKSAPAPEAPKEEAKAEAPAEAPKQD